MPSDISVDPDLVAQTVKRLTEAFDKAKATAERLPGQDPGGTDDPVASELNASIRDLLTTLGSLVDGLQKDAESAAENVKSTLADFDEFESSQTGQLNRVTADIGNGGQGPAAGASGGTPTPKATPGSGGW